MKHSTAIHPLKSKVNIVTISQWLAHANINTTNQYISIDLEMKRKAIDKIAPKDGSKNPKAPWQSNDFIFKLESLMCNFFAKKHRIFMVFSINKTIFHINRVST